MRGSFTTELALIFPVIFLVIIVMLQSGLFFAYRIYTFDVLQRGMLICENARNEGEEAENAMAAGKQYTEVQLQKIPIRIVDIRWDYECGWLEEEYTAAVQAEYSFLLSLPWQAQLKMEWSNPVQFRNRIDYIWEKGSKYFGVIGENKDE